MTTKIPAWIIEYDKKGYRSSAGRAINELLEIINKQDKDLSEFSEWCSESGWRKRFLEKEWFRETKSGDFIYKTTSQLIEMWKIETGRK